MGFNSQNENFLVGLKKDDEIVQIGTFSKGLKTNEKDSLIQSIIKNEKRRENGNILIEPGICVKLFFETIKENELINPIFNSFQLEVSWENCTWERLIIDNTFVEGGVKLTHSKKTLWKTPYINKEGFLSYLIQVSSYMLPFLERRTLTTIRYPHGIPGEFFYQKNCPDYAPSSILTKTVGGINYIVCNELSTLLWLGNQLAIEYHIPFQTIDSLKPLEIVFDLDPPSKEDFHLAIKAALEMKIIFDSLEIKSYPKLSGSKGLQIHIPIKVNSLSYEDTRIFMYFIAKYLIDKFPNDFTIERFKKKRSGKLYIDYLQHAERKTIISPYSTRGQENATVAAPLYWEEVNENLRIEKFNIPFVLDRLSKVKCPMDDFFIQENPNLLEIVSTLKVNL